MKNIRVVLCSFAILALSIIVIPPFLEIPEMGSSWRKDGKFVAALQEISKIIPENEVLVSASYDPAIYYFTNHNLQIPSKGISYNSLLNFMKKDNYLYLLIIEGKYNVPRGFTFDLQLTNLTKDFKEIATYTTDFKIIQLYKRIV